VVDGRRSLVQSARRMPSQRRLKGALNLKDSSSTLLL
jgi:hypothetical protein